MIVRIIIYFVSARIPALVTNWHCRHSKSHTLRNKQSSAVIPCNQPMRETDITNKTLKPLAATLYTGFLAAFIAPSLNAAEYHYHSDNAQEGLRTFAEKRSPLWKGH